jgi:hypothetical protein
MENMDTRQTQELFSGHKKFFQERRIETSVRENMKKEEEVFSFSYFLLSLPYPTSSCYVV